MGRQRQKESVDVRESKREEGGEDRGEKEHKAVHCKYKTMNLVVQKHTRHKIYHRPLINSL